MSIDEQLNIIKERYSTLAKRLNQSEKFKNIARIEQIGNIVRSARKTQGLSRKALCELCGVSYSTLNKIETGSVSVRLDIVMNIVNKLGLNLWIG
ncbi:MAG: helix-turn-helix domain-containing protein [Proteobacteria bacterium]|nr:helix-turn-helix domain-containing protein [Pseudomonadota bacterium]MBU1584855.1 helix-turn-helix domain-containing protein [Pseudomonadota bacterium]MBU2628771.1 helix-turn-helix domain-containing protein [Pseudomonadota bacterium]